MRFDSRLVDATIAEAASSNLVQDRSERRRLLLDRDRVVGVLVAEVLDGGSEMTKEEPARGLSNGIRSRTNSDLH